jgi:hypothetical protein
MTFWIDDAAKTFIFSDSRRLRVTRFDKSWLAQIAKISSTSSIGPTARLLTPISANSEDIQYEFNRADRTLTYAGSTTKDNVTTTIVASVKMSRRKKPE